MRSVVNIHVHEALNHGNDGNLNMVHNKSGKEEGWLQNCTLGLHDRLAEICLVLLLWAQLLPFLSFKLERHDIRSVP
jgi:hypothetical protein